MVKQIALFIPELGGMLVGFDWDMSLTDRAIYQNQFTEHPIEDPERSFLMDHNREKPVQLKMQLQVSANPLVGIPGIQRIVLFYERLLDVRSQQAVSPDAFFSVYTGLKLHENMAIRSINMKRNNDYPNVATFDIDLYEFRFARSPSLIQDQYLMDANNAQVSSANKPLVSDSDRMITEGTKSRRRPRIGRPNISQNTIISAAVATVGSIGLGALG